MYSLKMITFCKNESCPSSQALLAYQQGDLPSKESKKILRHLEGCDFCEAETDFYSHFPQSEENIVATDIPRPLYELAEALLGNSKKKFSLLNKLIEGKDLLKPEKV